MTDASGETPMSDQVSYKVDLHMHSTASDGLKSPLELCVMAQKLGLSYIALSDHDTLGGLNGMRQALETLRAERDGSAAPVCEQRRKAKSAPAPQADQSTLTFLPALELSSGTGGRVHLLGYAPNERDAALLDCLHSASADRLQRARRMLELLSQQGLRLSDEQRQELLSPLVGRAHIARVMVAQGMVKTMQEAFDRYLIEGGIAYVPRARLEPSRALAILKDAGAVVVLAHPRRLGLDETQMYALLEELISYGLDGVEAYHPSASRTDARSLADYARRHGLLVTGGSDYHGDPASRVRMARMPSGWAQALDDAQALVERTRGDTVGLRPTPRSRD